MPGLILGVILAGGKGRRMGGDKPFVSYRGRPLIAHAIAALAVQVDALCLNPGVAGTLLAARLAELGAEPGAALGHDLAFDAPDLAGRGPLSGVWAGLAEGARRGARAVVTLPCDMPHAPPDLVDLLVRAQAATGAPAVYVQGARPHPLCAVWTPALLAPLAAALRRTGGRGGGGLRVMGFLGQVGAVAMPVDDEAPYANINSPHDLK